MSSLRRVPDPYRELGVSRGATDEQVKAAHRRLAKRFHPDAPTGDRERFLAIQDAYHVLSDPLLRREWDRRHAPGPVRAGEEVARPRARAASGRWTRQEQEGVRRPRPARARPAGSGTTSPGSAWTTAPGSPGWEGSGREPGTRSHTWSAAGVPWWEDFKPHPRRAGQDARAASRRTDTTPGPGSAATAATGAGPRPTAGTTADARDGARSEGASGPASSVEPPAMDVYSRSSGAAWSMAARRYFRRGDVDLPRGGSFRYRGTQIVTGAEARRLAEEEARLLAEEQARRLAVEEARLAAEGGARVHADDGAGRSAAPRSGGAPAARDASAGRAPGMDARAPEGARDAVADDRLGMDRARGSSPPAGVDRPAGADRPAPAIGRAPRRAPGRLAAGAALGTALGTGAVVATGAFAGGMSEGAALVAITLAALAGTVAAGLTGRARAAVGEVIRGGGRRR